MNSVDGMLGMIEHLFNLKNTSDEFTIYYDETNNIRKLVLKDGGFNVAEPKPFVLGGIAHRGPKRSIELEELRQVLSIQKSAPEIKLKHLASGDFLDVLNSQKITAFLQWMLEQDFSIHYMALDPLFWSFADIVDSMLMGIGNKSLYPFIHQLKSSLTIVLRCDTEASSDFLYRYEYPNISPENRLPFLVELLDFIQAARKTLGHFDYQMLKGVVQMARSLRTLSFIEDNVPYLLINEFSNFYSNRLVTFKNSVHVLNIEERIKAVFIETSPEREGRQINYTFSDSKCEPGIQISDTVVGILGKMYSYLVETSAEEVMKTRDGMAGQSLTNACLLRDLIDKSKNVCNAFPYHVISSGDVDKLDMVLRFKDGSYA